MYSISFKKFANTKKLVIRNTKTGEKVEILPEFGASIFQLTLQKNKELFTIIKGNDNYDDFVKKYAVMYNNAKLLPFPNRINQGRFEFQGANFQLPINEQNTGHALHGFISDKKFLLASKKVTKTSGECSLYYTYAGDLNGYPFPFFVLVTFKLSEKGLKCETRVENLSNFDIPIGDGWHPYFSTGSNADELFIKIPATKYLERYENFIPTGNLLNTDKYKDYKQIGDTRFNDCFYIEKNNSKAETVIFDQTKKLKIKIWQETGDKKYNFIQYYIPSDRQSIAVEPMTSAPDAFNNKMGLIVLEPKQNIINTFGVELE